MCGFYADEQKIKEGDIALFNEKKIQILSAKHMKNNKTMNIVYKDDFTKEEYLLNFPYKTITTLQLLKRETKHNEL